MDLEFSDDQEELRRSVRAFLDRECPVGLVRKVVEDGDPAAELWRAITGLDWPALAIPEACGGIGLGFVEVAVVVEELGARVAPGPYMATATQFAPAIREAGSEEQRHRFLGAVAAGEVTGTLALADHPLRWAPGDVTATAERTGAGWTLRGKKHAVLAAPDVDEVAVAARVGDGLGLFVVPGAEVLVTPVHSLDQSRPLATVDLNGATIPPDRALGEPGSPASLHALERSVEEASTALAVETVGTCQALFDLVLQYAKDRHQFGVPIGSFQAVKHKMANCFVAIERARALAYFAVAAIAEDDPRRTLASAMAKAAADDCQRLVCQDAIQTFGGIAFTWEHDAHLYVKRAKTTGALFGGAPQHRSGVARSLASSVTA